jgi:hypothetical protein
MIREQLEEFEQFAQELKVYWWARIRSEAISYNPNFAATGSFFFEEEDPRRMLLQEELPQGAQLNPNSLPENSPQMQTACDPLPTTSQYCFLQDGQCWRLCFEDESYTFKNDRTGFKYLSILIRQQGQRIAAIELSALVSDAPGQGLSFAACKEAGLHESEDQGEPIIDTKARKEYEARLEELQELMSEAQLLNDTEKVEEYREEFEFVARECQRLTNRKGRIRRFGNAPEELARQRVSIAITRTIALISQHCPKLAAHLDKNVSRGGECSYSSSIKWILS